MRLAEFLLSAFGKRDVLLLRTVTTLGLLDGQSRVCAPIMREHEQTLYTVVEIAHRN